MSDPSSSVRTELEIENQVRFIGRYALHRAIASGGMATVYLGRLLGPVGFSRTVAIKRLHPHFASDPEFVSMFLDEARLAARIRHPNVVQTLDVVATKGELFLVMDYVHGGSLARLLSAGDRIPLSIAVAIMSGALQGLHAAHEAKSERGEPLSIIHRDVSPQNILVGSDGATRVLDFGVAKAAGRLQSTRDGQLKGKLAYMAPEQLMHEHVGRELDIYASAVVLWEVIAGARLFRADNEGATIQKVLTGNVGPATVERAKTADEPTKALLRQIDAVIQRGLAREPKDRHPTARAMALALEAIITPASAAQVAAWVEAVASEDLRTQSVLVAQIEGSDQVNLAPESIRDERAKLGARQWLDSISDAESAESAESGEPAEPAEPTKAAVPAAAVPLDASTTSMISQTITRPQPIWPAWIGPAIAVAISALVVAGFVTTRGHGADATLAAAGAGSAAAPTEAGSSPAPSAPAPPPSATADRAAASASAPVSPVSPVSLASVAPIVTAPAARATPSVTPPPRPTAASKLPAAECDPPFTYDARGHKHYKPECPL